MAKLLHFFTGPRLLRILRSEIETGRNYEPNFLESGGNKIITTIRFCWSLSCWTSPLILGLLYRRGHFTADGLVHIGKLLACVGVVYTAAVFVRGIGRFLNPDYAAFTMVLVAAENNLTTQNRRLLARYDFEFRGWPVDWRWQEANVSEAKKIQARSSGDTGISFRTLPYDILSYMCVHTFGRRMVYPGTTALINTLVEPTLIQGRAKFVEEKAGQRAKLLTEDSNEIDTMFLDRRHTTDGRGKTLVVCCEGNAGFYEIGTMATPMDLGYSVIGWNHPGFAGSTGIPLPEQEQRAIDAVMQYSIHRLGFTPDNIVLFAWSIGGYPATWAAMNYPDVKFVVLDATFDELLPLAIPKMPEFARGLVEKTVKRYLHLNIVDQLCKYPGPVLLIRRSMDEMITTRDPSAIHTNRGNYLLAKLLIHRYPNIIDEATGLVLKEWLSKTKAAQEIMWASHDVDPVWCQVALSSYWEENQHAYPWDIGENYTPTQKTHMALFLASKYMEDYDSTHCTPLPSSFFKKPWTPM